ncbi:NAD-dependent epimerase/dehydratase family protein [Vibrio breoganii]|uniref:NAD-dependent epimerase/dehydratase family protein n=1 Tax=Vibrio breoganii TaxID=553239 RepID=UPI000C82C12B|nr:NAD-dependent epimerase/dehydratase family protein [Vibrio breoganii]
MKKYLVTGANGYIGSSLMQKLGDNGIGVLRNATKSSLENKAIIQDINSKTDWADHLDGIDVVIHLAGIASKAGFSEEQYNEINHLGTVKLATQAANSGVKRFVFISTVAVMGSVGTFNEESETNPENDYANSKLNAENALRKIESESDMEIVIVRPSLVYGEGAVGNFALLQKLIQRLPFLPFGLANNKRSFISRDNLVDLLITCAEHPKAKGHVFLASEGPAISTKEFTNAIANGMNTKVIQLPLPKFIAKTLFKLINRPNMYAQLFDNLEVKSTKLNDILDWKALVTMKQSMSKLNEIKQ